MIINKRQEPAVWCPVLTGEISEEGYRITKDAVGEYRWWSNEYLPLIGDRVLIDFNGFGPGTVMCFFAEDGFLGAWVMPDVVPEYVKRQRKAKPYSGPFRYWYELGYTPVFGAEIARLEVAA